jgi:hypothetical protein
LALYNTISVEVQGLTNYLKQPGKQPGKFILYLDWRPIRGLKTRLADGKDMLLFDIERKPASETEWDALLGRPFYGPKGFTYKVPVSVGYENENALPTDVDNFPDRDNRYPLVVVNKLGFWIFAITFIASLWGFWWLANNSGIIRDTCPELPYKKRPLSLGRAQMAFWFYVVAASYCLIWLITSNRDSLTTSALTLIGISTLTALGATAISRSKSSTEETKRQDLDLEKRTIQTKLNDLDTKISAVPPPAD